MPHDHIRRDHPSLTREQIEDERKGMLGLFTGTLFNSANPEKLAAAVATVNALCDMALAYLDAQTALERTKRIVMDAVPDATDPIDALARLVLCRHELQRQLAERPDRNAVTRAAEILREEAQTLKSSYSSGGDGEWSKPEDGEDIMEGIARENHDEMLAVAAALDGHVDDALHVVPEGYVVVPKVPTPGLLMSIAIRLDHAIGMPGYYDQFSESSPGTHARRLELLLSDARRAHEEITGQGFYDPESEQRYANMKAEAAKPREQDE
jgi:hypothetical protein